MTREQRLQSARATKFLQKHDIKDIVRHYSRWYGVDLLCAITELRLLGVKVPSERENAIRKMQKLRQQKKMEAELQAQFYEDSDEVFAYIAGYTSGGVPYGVTWDELNAELK